MPIHQLDPVMFRSIPTLKQQAVQSWYAASHPGWAIYWKPRLSGWTVGWADGRIGGWAGGRLGGCGWTVGRVDVSDPRP
eukprot:358684-Chlamydomonas_euryale.AAC.4